MDCVIIKKSHIDGLGAFAGKEFAKGELILEIDYSDVVDDPNHLDPSVKPEHLETFLDGTVILMHAPEVYINHSCEPNSYLRTIGESWCVYAMRAIKKGEELTHHYSVSNFQNWNMKCRCGSANCLGIVPGDFFRLPINIQLQFIPWLDDWYQEMHRERLAALIGEQVF